MRGDLMALGYFWKFFRVLIDPANGMPGGKPAWQGLSFLVNAEIECILHVISN
jgi:hypothetical protein